MENLILEAPKQFPTEIYAHFDKKGRVRLTITKPKEGKSVDYVVKEAARTDAHLAHIGGYESGKVEALEYLGLSDPYSNVLTGLKGHLRAIAEARPMGSAQHNQVRNLIAQVDRLEARLKAAGLSDDLPVQLPLI